MTNPDTTWPLQAARNGLSQLVKSAASAPQTITVRGKAAAVVLSLQHYALLNGPARQSLSACLLRPGLLLDDEFPPADRAP